MHRMLIHHTETKEHSMPFTFYYSGYYSWSHLFCWYWSCHWWNYCGWHSLDDIGYFPPWLPHLLQKNEKKTLYKVCVCTIRIIKNDPCHLECLGRVLVNSCVKALHKMCVDLVFFISSAHNERVSHTYEGGANAEMQQFDKHGNYFCNLLCCM